MVVILTAGLGYLAWHWRRLNAPLNRRWRWLITGLLLLVFLTGLIGGFPINRESIPIPGAPTDTGAPVAVIFAALAWMLAGGLLGPLPAMALGFVAGFFSASMGGHSALTMLEVSLMAGLFAAMMRQRYRTRPYRIISHPLVAAMALSALYFILHFPVIIVSVQGQLVDRIQYALSVLPADGWAMAITLLTGGLLAEIAALLLKSWGGSGPLAPSPSERSLQTRFFLRLMPLIIIFIGILIAGDWMIAGKAAQDLLYQQMSSTARMAADNVPYLLETGQTLIQQLANQPEMQLDDRGLLEQALLDSMHTFPFFNRLGLIDVNNNVLAAYPDSLYLGPMASEDERLGMQNAMTGIPFQMFTGRLAPGQTTTPLAFMAAIPAGDEPVRRVLVGHVDLSDNTFGQPIKTSLGNLAGSDGQGMLVYDNKRILVQSGDPQLMTTEYAGQIGAEPLSYEGVATNGARRMFIYQPVPGRIWGVVVSVPVRRAQQLALEIAYPLLLAILGLAAFATVVIRFSLHGVTHTLETLSTEAVRLADGHLEQPTSVQGADEVGQLSRAFEQMRVSLKARLDELNRLLVVSQGVASSLDISEAVQPVLESALAQGSAARLALSPDVLPEWNQTAGQVSTPVSFGLGVASHQYRYLDEQILAITRGQERLVLSNLLRPRLLTLTPGLPRPESLIAVALRHESEYYGALWVAYDQPHTFSEEEVRFLITLAGQAALAAMNARLFLTAEIGRRRLESILDSSPDPVLVTDQRDCLLLANPAAWQVLRLADAGDESQVQGAPIDQLLKQSQLIDLLRSANPEKSSAEVALADGQTYLATATPVIAEGQRVGRVCMLRDVTRFKELNALKSDFVSNVSHDLRSPLTLMRGYATMMEMVGQLNEQQTGYVRKIITGVESMSRLVNNLLDIGRIEAGVGLQPEMIPVQDVLERVINGLQLSANQKHIQLSLELPPGTTPLIEADQALLEQAIQNLVENAIKYTKPNGTVHVKLQVQPIGMVFQVQDSGVGVSPMDLPRLFEKFYRGVQQGSMDARGTGLGLAIVKSIAERHGGRAWAESSLGKGSTFYFSIPLRQQKTTSAISAK